MGLWDTWSHELIMLLVGLPMLAITVAVAAQAGHTEREPSPDDRVQRSMQALVAFVCFSPAAFTTVAARRLSHMQVLCRNLLGVWSVLGAVVLLPIFVPAAGLYQCGAVSTSRAC